jgi:MFS family permease
MIGMLVAGRLAAFAPKKWLEAAFLLIMALGGAIGFLFASSLGAVHTACAVFGFGNGGLIPTTSGLIAENFVGGKRAHVMGLQPLFINCGSIALNLIAGWVVALQWKYLFLVYLGSLIVAIVVLVVLPEGKAERERGESQAQSQCGALPRVFLAVFMPCGFFIGLGMMTFMLNAPADVLELGIGDETRAGVVAACFSVGAVSAGLALKSIMERVGSYVFPLGMTCMAAGLWMCHFSASLVPLCAGAFLVGAAFILHNTSYYTVAPSNAGPGAVTLTISLYSVSMQLGMVLSPAIVTPLACAFVDSAAWARFAVGASIISLASVFSWFVPRLLRSFVLTIDK